MKYARSSFGKKAYICLCSWPEEVGVQCGGSGVVFTNNSLEEVLKDPVEAIDTVLGSGKKMSHYRTAFFEAFPKNPSCFIRGEGKTVEEAEKNCFAKYEKIMNCSHPSFDRRGREDGYAFCSQCSYSGMLLQPLTHCAICSMPAHYSQNLKDNWYCKDHYYQLEVNDVCEIPTPDQEEDYSMFSLLGQRHKFIEHKVSNKCLKSLQVQRNLSDKEMEEIENIFRQLMANYEFQLVFKEKKQYKELWPLLEDEGAQSLLAIYAWEHFNKKKS